MGFHRWFLVSNLLVSYVFFDERSLEAAMNFLQMRGETGSLIFSFISDLYLLAICSGGEMLCLYFVMYVNRMVSSTDLQRSAHSLSRTSIGLYIAI